MEFGTNTGRQGTYDPRDPRQRRMAMDRLSQLEDEYGDRLQIGFTGETGLNKNDAHGWSRMLNAQTEAKNIRNIAEGKGPVQIGYGGTMQSRQLPRSMEPLGMYDDDIRRAGVQAQVAAAKGPFWNTPGVLRNEQVEQAQATTEYLQNRGRQSGTIADEMAADADPWQRRREGLIDQETADLAFKESYPRRRGTMATQAADKVLDTTEAQRAALDLELTHPLTREAREQKAREAEQRASMEAIGRIFAQPENFEAVGGVGGIPGIGRGAGQPDPNSAPPGQPQAAVPPDFAEDISAQFQERFGRAPNPRELQTMWQRFQAQGR
jgi:hypothetical protein